MHAPLAELLRYNRWAVLTLLDACQALGEARLDARPQGISGSVRELLHIVGGQQTFVLRTRGRRHEGELNRGSPWPGFAVLRGVAVRSSDELIAVAEELVQDSELRLPWRGREYRYPKSCFLVHAVQHGVEHRTEVKLAPAQLGVQTPDLDAWFYAEAMGFGTAV
ncbi:MAG TPA: DinB family protein [Dehalococcoidia bacterium]|nr:DinB family protein [Dehalococcoidia bacterium]